MTDATAPAGDPMSLHVGARYKRRLFAAFCLIGGFFLVELVGGLLTNSLVLLSDAGHMLTDVLGLGMALAAIQAASTRRANRRRSFGLYRLEILAALANAVLLVGLASFVIYEAVRRLGQPPEVHGVPMLIIGTLGLVVNVVAFLLLRDGKDASLNIQGAYLEVLADLVASIGVVVAGVILQVTGVGWIDPLFAIAIGLFILPRALKLGAKAVRVLIQAAPENLDVDGLEAGLADIHGVTDVHDLHVWTLTSGIDIASVHLRLQPGADSHHALDEAHAYLRDGHGIEHATIQVEPDDHVGCEGCVAMPAPSPARTTTPSR